MSQRAYNCPTAGRTMFHDVLILSPVFPDQKTNLLRPRGRISQDLQTLEPNSKLGRYDPFRLRIFLRQGASTILLSRTIRQLSAG